MAAQAKYARLDVFREEDEMFRLLDDEVEISLNSNLVAKHRKEKKKRYWIIIVALVVLIVLIGIIIYFTAIKGKLKKGLEKDHHDDDILLAVLIDGFKPEYLSLGITPTLTKLAKNGVSGKMRPMFPPNTYSNLYSVYTGLYPRSHGIIQNTFYDEARKEFFDYDDTLTALNKKWWKGEPIWITAQKNNIKTLGYTWRGPKELEPTYWTPLNFTIPWKQRIDEVIDYMKMQKHKRPQLIVMYLEQPDLVSHGYGPFANRTLESVKRVDETFKHLVQRLQENNLKDKVNMILTADHGMVLIDCNNSIKMYNDTLPPNTKYVRYASLMNVYLNSTEQTKDLYKKLKCSDDRYVIYKTDSNLIPKRLHYQNNKRIGDLLAMTKIGYRMMRLNAKCEPGKSKGEHGYDNLEPKMQALFLAQGPAFQHGIKDIHIQNIEIYNLMADLLGIKGAPNNGTQGSYNYFLNKKYKVDIPRPSLYSFENLLFRPDSKTSGCKNCKCRPDCEERNATNMLDYKKLDLAADKITTIQKKHFPWSPPKSYTPNQDVFILTQVDFIVGFDQSLNIPIWEGHKVSKKHSGHKHTKECFHPDPRVDEKYLIDCSLFNQSELLAHSIVAQDNIGDDSIVNIISNVVPMYRNFIMKKNSSQPMAPWNYLNNLVKTLSSSYENLYVISGVIFDKDNDGIADDIRDEKIPIATHFYKVLIKCKQYGRSINHCGENLDVLSFILPHSNEQLCQYQSISEYVYKYVATLRDVELLTGLDFLSDISLDKQAQLKAELNTVDSWIR